MTDHSRLSSGAGLWPALTPATKWPPPNRHFSCHDARNLAPGSSRPDAWLTRLPCLSHSRRAGLRVVGVRVAEARSSSAPSRRSVFTGVSTWVHAAWPALVRGEREIAWLD